MDFSTVEVIQLQSAKDSTLPHNCVCSQEQIYSSSDISLLLREVQKAQIIINKIIGMRQGLLGTRPRQRHKRGMNLTHSHSVKSYSRHMYGITKKSS